MTKLLILIVGVALLGSTAVALYSVRPSGESQLTTDGPVASWQIPSGWSVAHGEYEGNPIFTRFNVALLPLAGRAEFSTQIGAAVPLNDPTDDGLPQGKEFAQLDEIEDLLERRLTEGNESLLAGVITTKAMREFVLYTSDAERAVVKIKQLTQEITHHRLQWVVNDDPQWQVFKDFSGR